MRRMIPQAIYRRVVASLVLTSLELFLAVFCMFVSVPLLIKPESLAPNSVLALMPKWAVYAWAAGLALGGICSFLGLLFTEYRLERMGVSLKIATVGVFTMAFASNLPRTFTVFILCLLFTLALVARYWVLGRLILIQQARIAMLKEEMHRDGTR
jgi:hypothetical protein